MKYLIFILCTIFSTILYAQPFTWTFPENLSDIANDGASSASICVESNGNIYVVWRYPSTGGGDQDLFMSWNDGQIWYPAERIFNDSLQVYNPRLAIDTSGVLHVSFTSLDGEYGRILYIKRENDIWSTAIQLSVDSLGPAYGNEILVDRENNVHVFWGANNIYHSYYNGSEWEPLEKLPLPSNCYDASFPKSATDSQNNIHLIYLPIEASNSDRSLFYQKYDGDNWSGPVKLNDTLYAVQADIAIDNNNTVHVIWDQRIELYGSKSEIYYCSNRNQGWTAPINISNLNKDTFYPVLKVYKEKPLVFFSASSGNYFGPMYYAFPDSAGWHVNNWELASKPGVFDFETEKDSIIHFVYPEHTRPGLFDIYYTAGTETVNSIREESYSLQKFTLSDSYPNPTNSEVNILLSVIYKMNLDIIIYDISGEEVKKIFRDKYFIPGKYKIAWDGKNNFGKAVSSGLYFVVFRNGKKINSRKVLLIK